MGHVTIGSDFFRKSLNDYLNWQQAWGRELIQNSIDCGATEIHFTIESDGDKTIAKCTNNGPPMDHDTLVNKFLCLGATTKIEGESVGGFGIAKTLICLAHEHYTIHTGQLLVTGSGGQYEITPGDTEGTTTTVTMKGDQAYYLIDGIQKIAGSSQWKGTLTVNGTTIQMGQSKGAYRRDLTFAKVYTNNSQKGIITVRINGLTMFQRSTSVDKMVILELTKPSQQILSTNRDSIRYPYSQELNDFIDEINVDNKSALYRKEPQILHYPGHKIQRNGHNHSPQITVQLPSKETTPQILTESTTQTRTAAYTATEVETYYEHTEQPRQTKTTLDFLIKNETNLTIPDYYLPGSTNFSDYSHRLSRIWAQILVQIHTMKRSDHKFSIGFIFNDESLAQYSLCSNYGRVYYIAPASIVEQSSSHSKSFKKNWSFDSKGKKRLVAIAAHEFVHGLGYDYHNEEFASVYTDLMGDILGELSDFNWCFK